MGSFGFKMKFYELLEITRIKDLIVPVDHPRCWYCLEKLYETRWCQIYLICRKELQHSKLEYYHFPCCVPKEIKFNPEYEEDLLLLERGRNKELITTKWDLLDLK